MAQSRHFLEMIPMRDGIRLRTRIRLPEGPGPWPVILERAHNTYSPSDDLLDCTTGDAFRDRCALVVQGVRGCNGSEGVERPLFINNAWNEKQDGYDTAEWILRQDWADGRIAVTGLSARAGFTNMLGGTGAPGIALEWPERGMGDLYRGVLYWGGAWRKNETSKWYAPFGNNAVGFALSHPFEDTVWKSMDVTKRQEHRNHPVIIVAAWYGTYLESSINNYISLRAHGGPVARKESKLILVFRGHEPLNRWRISTWTCEGDEPPPGYGLHEAIEHYLLDAENGYDRLPRVTYYLMGDRDDYYAPGNEFRFADNWPPPGEEAAFYLGTGNTLTPGKAEDAGSSLTWIYNPRDPVPSVGGAVHYIGPGPSDQRAVESREDVLIFETLPLKTPLEIAGPVTAYIHAASDCVDTDFTAKLTDVYPDGRSLIVTDGIIRARSRNSLEKPEPLEPGKVYEFPIHMGHTAYAFNTGHRIRIAISSSNYPRFEANPNTGADPARWHLWKHKARNTLWIGGEHASRIVFHMIGPDADSDGHADIDVALPGGG